jgi:hypothetical protein
MKEMPKLRYYAGLDLGQQGDYTALCIIEDTETRQKDEHEDPRRWHVVHLERFPLRTKYGRMMDHVASLMKDERLANYKRLPYSGTLYVGRPKLFVDKTGVGAGVIEMLTERDVEFTGVQITGGASVVADGTDSFNVPKKDLVAALEVPYHNDEVAVAAGLKLWPVLREELQNFRRKVSLATGHDSYEHWRESDHDDLVLACALAFWGARQPEFMPLIGRA